MSQFKTGDAVSQEDLEDWSWLGDDWENHVEDLPKEEQKDESRDVMRIMDHNPPTLRITSDCVGFRFLVIGEDFGDFSCGLEWMLMEDGPEYIFKGLRDDFLKMAESEPEEYAGKVGDLAYILRRATRDDSRIKRIITAWHYWSSTTHSMDGPDFDCGVEFLGLVRLGHLSFEVVN